MVTLHLQPDRSYAIEQDYLGLVDGQLKVIARTLFPQRAEGQTP